MRFAVFNPDAERREGLKALLRQIDRNARFNDVYDWLSVDSAMRRFTPNLLVVDWHAGLLPEELGASIARHPQTPVAVLADDTSPAAVEHLLAIGVRGVIPRSTDARLIVLLLEVVLLGGDHAPISALRGNVPPVHAGKPSDDGDAPHRRTRRAALLSPRQQQILRCVHMGNTNKMIARALGISEGTVKIHLASIFRQLGAPNRAAAVAIYNGWLASGLQVLCPPGEGASRPVRGQPGPIPLRRRDAPFRYPLHADDAIPPPLAAEPGPPGGPSARLPWLHTGKPLATENEGAGPSNRAPFAPFPPSNE